MFISIMIGACSSSKIEQNISAEERFALGIEQFNKKNYLEAINEFSIVTLQFPGSNESDDAQYYLGECRLNREEYLLATYEYERLKRNMPVSPFVSLAQYKIAYAYDMLSPTPPLDQSYTLKAIDEYQLFIEYFPNDTLVALSEERISKLRERLAEKEYKSAILYMKMEYYKSATIYFDYVLEYYHDSKYAEGAYVGKIESLIKRRKAEDAKITAEKFFEKYPNSEQKNEVLNLLKQ